MKIKGYEDYDITEDGIIIKSDGRILKQCNNIKGYKMVNLWNSDGEKMFYIHRLVAQTFIPNPNNKKQVNHIDEDKSNNNVKNLNWMTCKENINWGTGVMKRTGRNNYLSKTKEYYSTHTTRKSDFKKTCIKQGWELKNFIEIWNGEKTKHGHKKYLYIEK